MILRRPRLVLAAGTGALLFLLLPSDWRAATRLLVAWDSGTALYLFFVAWMMAHSDAHVIRRRAAMQDESGRMVLALTTGAALASLAAIVAELSKVKTMVGYSGWHVALAALTVCLSWAFMHTIFALHYAHQYYSERKKALVMGLEFPGHEPPDYWDFVYYAFIIGTTAQTADVNITSRLIRRTTTLHCVAAFFFNTIILALTINISAGLF